MDSDVIFEKIWGAATIASFDYSVLLMIQVIDITMVKTTNTWLNDDDDDKQQCLNTLLCVLF